LADGRAAPEAYCGSYSFGPGSGGGSGGTIRLNAPILDLAGTLSATGGVGCAFWSYVGGGGGRVSLSGTQVTGAIVRLTGGDGLLGARRRPAVADAWPRVRWWG